MFGWDSGRGWYQRTMALQYLRNNSDFISGQSTKSVVYFADDDNSYDIRLFNDYIRNVQKVGIWAVGEQFTSFYSNSINTTQF